MYALPLLLMFYRSSEGPGFKVDDFNVLGSDRKKYTVKTLTRGKPVLLVNLFDIESSQGIADLNRLNRMMEGKAKVVGLTTLRSYDQMRARIKERGIRFLVLCDDRSYSIFLLVPRLHFHPGDRVDYLANALLLPDGRLTHVWGGYNRWTLKRMSQDAKEYAKVKLKLDLDRFPKDLQFAAGGFYGSGEP